MINVYKYILARLDDLTGNLVASSEVKVIEPGGYNFLTVKDVIKIGCFVFALFSKSVLKLMDSILIDLGGDKVLNRCQLA